MLAGLPDGRHEPQKITNLVVRRAKKADVSAHMYLTISGITGGFRIPVPTTALLAVPSLGS